MARNTWVRLPNGKWGVSVWGEGSGQKQGEQVKVTRRDGRSADVELGEPVKINGKTTYYEVADGPGDHQGESGEQGESQGESKQGESQGESKQGEQGESEGKTPPPFKAPEPGSDEFCEQQHEEFFAEWNRLREAINREAETVGSAFDSLDSMRPVKDAEAAFAQGIPATAMLAAMVLHWPDEAKRRHNAVYKADLAKIGGKVPEGIHPLTGYIAKLAAARIPIMLVGPAGVGKSHLTESLAELLGLPFADCSMTAGATPAWLLGRWTMGTNPEGDEFERKGFVHAPFTRCYINGGVFVFEEFDSADANMLLVANKALANDSFYNPINGEHLRKSENLVAVANANTYGLGANAQYTGRERLDGASIDRFRMGRVYMGLDLKLTAHIAKTIRQREQARKEVG